MTYKYIRGMVVAALGWCALGGFGESGHALAQTPSFTPLGTDNGASAISNQGTVTGYADFPTGQHAYRWTQAGGMEDLGVLPGGISSYGTGISADGGVVVGYGNGSGFSARGFRWSGGSMSILNPLPGGQNCYPQAVSGNGSVAVGYSESSSGPRAVLWQGPNPQNLGSLPQGGSAFAYGVSHAGDIVVGLSGNTAFRWTSAGGMQSLGFLPGGNYSSAYEISADGATIVGTATDSSGNLRAFRWTSQSGMQNLGILAGDFLYSAATSVSQDGSVIVGLSYSPGNTPRAAMRWTPQTGLHDLFSLLASYGLDVAGWDRTGAVGVSPDGTTIVGYSDNNPAGNSEAWVAVVPLDADGDGLLDLWESQNGGIDGDGNGTIDVNLYNLGARPDHKDLFIEVDAMSPDIAISPLAESMLFNAFSLAPFENPDGIGGVNLHLVDLGVDAIPFEESWDTDVGGCWPLSFNATKADHFGSPGDSAAVKAAKAKAFRYCIAINRLVNPGDGSGVGGCGYVPGRDFVIAVGGYNDESTAAVLMHELGHNLGLNHGGGDDVNGKPNYVSIMNYALSYRSTFSGDFWRLDYSRSELEPLVESDLDETTGIAAPLGFFETVFMPYGYDDEDAKGKIVRRMHYLRLDGSPVDWDRDGLYDRSGADVTNNDVNYAGPGAPIGGLNTPAPNEVLAGFDDWANVQLAIPDASGLAGSQLPAHEPPPAPILVAWLNANVPAICRADIATNGAVNIDDLLAVISAWGPCPAPPAACPANIVNSGASANVVNIDDLLAVISAWGPCP